MNEATVIVEFTKWCELPQPRGGVLGYNAREWATLTPAQAAMVIEMDAGETRTRKQMEEHAAALRVASEKAREPIESQELIGVRFNAGTEVGHTFYQASEVAFFAPDEAARIVKSGRAGRA
jgi:hypothetical protein